MPTALRSRADGARTAALIGCEGAHEVDGGWAPCESADALRVLIRYGVRSYRRRTGKPQREAFVPGGKKPTRKGFEKLRERRRSADSINAALLSGSKTVQRRDRHTGGSVNANIPWGKPAGWASGRRKRRVSY
jgi:hypothetical protein